MMEDHSFCDSCPGCRPALLDPTTGTALPNDHPIMVKINHMWDTQTTYDQRKSFIEVTLHNSRDPVDMENAKKVAKMMQDVNK